MTPDPRRWWGLAGLCTAAALVWLAFADLGVAVPTIADDLGGSLSKLQWANNAFSLVTGALVLAAGRFGDIFGRRRMLYYGLVIFGAVSLLTAAAPGVAGLIAGRALMGVGAALILPATLSLIPSMFPKHEQPTAFGAWMAVAWAGQGAGPAIGGFFTSTIGWRASFWINAPLGVIAIVIVARSCLESRDVTAPREMDVAGIATSALAAFLLLYGCTEGQELGFGDPLVLAAILGAVACGVAFVVIEKRIRNPLVDLGIFRSRPFDSALIANTIMNMVFAGMSFLLTLYLQNQHGYSPLEAGLLLLPSTITILAFNPLGARIAQQIGPRWPIIAGVAVLGVGTAGLSVLGAHYAYWIIALGLLVLGAGIGLMSTPLSNTAVTDPPAKLAGTASGTFKMTSMLGGGLGVAGLLALAQVFQSNESGTRATEHGYSMALVVAAAFSVLGAIFVYFFWPISSRRSRHQLRNEESHVHATAVYR